MLFAEVATPAADELPIAMLLVPVVIPVAAEGPINTLLIPDVEGLALLPMMTLLTAITPALLAAGPNRVSPLAVLV